MTIGKLLLCSFVLLTTGCIDQFDPTGDWKKFDQEQANANAGTIKLAEDGSLPAAGALASEGPTDPEVLFTQYCASCHGADGKADGPTAAAMDPRPRNMADPAWQDSVDDARIALVIKKGGMAVNLSATMPAWGAELSDKQISILVSKIRSLR